MTVLRTATTAIGDGRNKRDNLVRQSDPREMDVQLVADEQNEDRAERRKDNARRMEAWVAGLRKNMSDGSTKKRTDDAERNCPEDRHVYVHD